MLLANIPKAKYAIHLGRDLMDQQLCGLCISYLHFTILNVEWPHWKCHTTHIVSKKQNFSKTFDDWNTATQCLNLFTLIWKSYFKVCFNFLLYLMLISNIYQNSYKGDKRHFHFQYWPLKQRNLNMTFFLLLWVSFPQCHCVEIGFI